MRDARSCLLSQQAVWPPSATSCSLQILSQIDGWHSVPLFCCGPHCACGILELHDHVGHSRIRRSKRDSLARQVIFYGLRRFPMADDILFLTELVGLKVYDLKG